MIWGHRGLMVIALDGGAGSREFKPHRYKLIFSLMEWFDETVRRRRREKV